MFKSGSQSERNSFWMRNTVCGICWTTTDQICTYRYVTRAVVTCCGWEGWPGWSDRWRPPPDICNSAGIIIIATSSGETKWCSLFLGTASRDFRPSFFGIKNHKNWLKRFCRFFVFVMIPVFGKKNCVAVVIDHADTVSS